MTIRKKNRIPVIDLFAGPGGLSEGFSRYSDFRKSSQSFQVKLSIEKDPIAAKTLRLRSFFRSFPDGTAPECYYNYIRGDKEAFDQIRSRPEWQKAENHVWNDALGEIDVRELHNRIRAELAGAKDWVLLGGPPCQAYSLIGRARMTGLGHKTRINNSVDAEINKLKEEKEKDFLQDHRHTLYREYLRIVAVHKPAVFVMENVKGILSAKLPDGTDATGTQRYIKAFSKIRQDLEKPWEAIRTDREYDLLAKLRDGDECEYELFSFVKKSGAGLFNEYNDRDFLIRSEEYGVPQKRHRVIILGVRKDIEKMPSTLKSREIVPTKHVLQNMPRLRSGLSKQKDSAETWLETLKEAVSVNVLKNVDKNIGEVMSRVISRNSTDLTRGAAYTNQASKISTESSDLKKWIEDQTLNGTIQHETRGHMNSDLGRYLFVSTSGFISNNSPKLDDWPDDLLPAHKNVFDPRTRKPKVDGFKDRFKVQLYDQPASTITAHISKDGHYFIHPDPEQCRSLTVREAARIQTFPDNYFFEGNRTQQYHQVGNAVPPYLTVQLADIVAELLSSLQND